jgi:uncharacterized protein (UPF0333 family)
MIMKKTSKKGQAVLEFTIVLVIVIGAFIAMQLYMKRGIQGRWKSTIDDFGEQYDPRLTNSDINYAVSGTSSTQIQAIQDAKGFWTRRIDNSNSTTTTQGSTAVGAE